MRTSAHQDKEELDRFCDAMIAIRAEIAEVESGAQPQEGNVLKNAPHTAAVVMADTWDRPYSRAKAAYPQAGLRATKFWPTTSRVNDTYGDRNLVRARPMKAHALDWARLRAPAHEPSTWHRCARARPSRRSSRRRTSSRRRCKRTRKYGQVHGAQDDLAMRAAGDRSAARTSGMHARACE